MEKTSSSTSVAFVVTGFGRFQGVSNNPTTILVGRLKEHMQKEEGQVGLASAITTQVFETSADCVKRELNILYDKVCTANQEACVIVFLHLGVNYRGIQFQLEQCAYNDATFRVPDERGYEPQQECVLEETSLGTCYETNLDVRDLCEQLNKMKKSTHVVSTVVSTDPGRFVCNYTYCYSLSKTKSHNETGTARGEKPRVLSLFIHVPPFDVVKEEEQLQFVTNAIKIIYQQVQPQVA